MSYSNTTRTSRLRQQAIQRNERLNDAGADQEPNFDPSPEQTSTFQHRDGYSIRQPDMRKREKIQKNAMAEAKAYENYTQTKKKAQYTTTVAAVGGGNSFPESPASHSYYNAPGVRTRKPAIPAQPTLCTKHGSSSLRSQSLRLDEPEIERHKQVQRQKSEINQRRELERQRRLDADRRRKNDSFLSRLEGNK